MRKPFGLAKFDFDLSMLFYFCSGVSGFIGVLKLCSAVKFSSSCIKSLVEKQSKIPQIIK